MKLRRRRYGQVSMEHIMMVAIAMLTIIPVIYIFYSYSQSSTDDIRNARLVNIGRNLLNNAESIYYLGQPSRVTLEETFPEGVKNMTIISDPALNIYELVFTVGQNNSLVLDSKVPVNGTFDQSGFSQGIKNILIESEGSYVNISIS